IAIPAIGYIMFLPPTRLADLIPKAEFLVRHLQVKFINFSQSLQLLPGTPIVRRMEEAGLADPEREHWDVGGYRFADPRVGFLASRLEGCNNQITLRSDAAINYIEVVLAILERRVRSAGLNPAALPDPGRFKALKRRLGGVYLDFFRSAVELAAGTWNEREFRRMMAARDRKVTQTMGEMQNWLLDFWGRRAPEGGETDEAVSHGPG
ncbi:MAG: hypothetical protein K6T75_02945, partial [Acetobacteraceae bacterium]|nr:hypothetical protein [Acetobacteraceae bacterium]